MEITSSEREHFVVIKWKENRTSFCFFYWARQIFSLAKITWGGV